MTDAILQIGHVVEVSGSRVVGELEASVEDLYRTYRSRRYAVGQVGSIVKIEAGDHLVFGLVTSLRMVETDEPEAEPTRRDMKWLVMDLLGEGMRTGLAEGSFEFKRGVHTYPLPGHRIFIATATELQRIYAPPSVASIKAGFLSQAAAIPIHLQTDELLAKHFAVLGTTGAGKSCAVSLLIHSMVQVYQHSHIVLLDPHDEYGEAFKDIAEPFDPTILELPHWLLNLDESIGLFIGKTEHVATSQANILKAGILHARMRSALTTGYTGLLTVDTPVPYSMTDLIETIKDQSAGQTGSKKEPYEKILSKIDILQKDKRFAFLIRDDDEVSDSMANILARILRTPVNARPVSVINLSGVPSDVIDVLISLLARLIFDFAVWTGRGRIMPMLLVCEEAHRYIPRSEEAAFEPARGALGRIAKEGRKYGVSLGLVTQRPSELSETALSQCNTIIALRMSNEQDQNFVKRALPDAVTSLVDALPAMRTQEAIIAGQGVTVPVRLFFDTLPQERQPRSHDVAFSTRWQQDSYDLDFVNGVIDRWRNQRREETHGR
jgi:DNA helicase HerA-like ATPase